MKKRIALMFSAMMLLAAAPVPAAGADVRVCALTKAFDCLSDEGCKEVSLEEMDLPRFVKIDLGAKAIASLDKRVSRPDTAFTAIERLEGMIVLHGVDARGWSMSIAEGSGGLTLTASGEDEGFVVFGNCILP
ncbi:MAG: hypothetical protein ACXWW2_08565 [Candidatus Deferrimicrobiaceae bacterium]